MRSGIELVPTRRQHDYVASKPSYVEPFEISGVALATLDRFDNISLIGDSASDLMHYATYDQALAPRDFDDAAELGSLA